MSSLADGGDAILAMEARLIRSGVVSALFAAVPSCAWLDLQLASGSVVSVRREDCLAAPDTGPAEEQAAKLAARQAAPPPQVAAGGVQQTKGAGGMSMKAMNELADKVFEAVRTWADRRLEGVMKFEGPHVAGRTYRRGACVQRDRGLHVATVDVTTETPGTSSQWRKIASS